MAVKVPKGTRDIFGDDIYYWQELEKILLEVCNLYNVSEMRTPVFEYTELFARGIGDTTDVVQKEMYTFKDKGERSLTLRPEGTSPVVRSYIENSLYAKKLPAKLFYIISAFRYERPQAGRYRQFHQFGVEYFGATSPVSDAEVISLLNLIMEKIGLKPSFEINSIGCADCRKDYNLALKDFIKMHLDNLCPNCKNRFEKNPLRILDCKEESCRAILKDAPITLDSLDEECAVHFTKLKENLDSLGINYIVNSKIVRGLDYYTKTVFEVFVDGFNGAVAGGGRYDGLVEELGGPKTAGIGFAFGLDRLILAMQKANENLKKPPCKVYIGSFGEAGALKASQLAFDLRKKGIVVECDIMDRKVKAQMKYANSIEAEYSLIIGENELETNLAEIKNMQTGENTKININEIFEFFNK